ncbi:MAG: DUF4276 family protein [bacterium]|nr:DUF4276 family protein [bacterium]
MGLIVEGLADIQVCEYLVKQFAPHITLEKSISMINKPKLIANCGESASLLLEQGCDRVVILWDLYPPWGEKDAKPCRKEDRDAIIESLKESLNPKDQKKVFLVCIENMLEAWLLYDENALKSVLSRPTRPIKKLTLDKHPERIPDPKAYLIALYSQHGKGRYTDYIDAIKIVRLLDLSRLRKCETFVRFALKVADIKLS